MRIEKVEYQEFGLPAAGYPIFRLSKAKKGDQAAAPDTQHARELIYEIFVALSALGPCEIAEITKCKRKHGAVYLLGFHECFNLLLSDKTLRAVTFGRAERLIDCPEFHDTYIYLRYDNGIPEIWLSDMWVLEDVRAAINSLQPLAPSLLPDLDGPAGIWSKIKSFWHRLRSKP